MNLYMENGSNPFDDFINQLTEPVDQLGANVRFWLTDLQEVQGVDPLFVEILRWLYILFFAGTVLAVVGGPFLLLYKWRDIKDYLRERKRRKEYMRSYSPPIGVGLPVHEIPGEVLGQQAADTTKETLTSMSSSYLDELEVEFLAAVRDLIKPGPTTGTLQRAEQAVKTIDVLLNHDPVVNKYAPILGRRPRVCNALQNEHDRLKDVIKDRELRDLFASYEADFKPNP